MKRINFSILLFLISVNAISQSYIGFLTDNYSGIHGVISNPANIVDSRFKTDINLLGASVFAGNDYYGVNVLDAIKSGYDFDEEANKMSSNNNNLGANLDVLGPSFMFNLNEKNSIAIFSRVRGFVNVNKVNGNSFELLENENTDNILINEEDVYGTANSWTEFGVSYAGVFFNKGEHFVKGGVSLKYIQGIASAYISGSNLFYEENEIINNPLIDTEVIATGNLRYGASQNDFDDDFINADEATGFGIDLGFVYEWRPNYKEYVKTNSEGEKSSVKDKNKYKLKLGLSVTDLGNINYKEGFEEEYVLNLNSNDIDDVDDLDDLSSSFYSLTNLEEEYKVKLPTALHVNADYNINNKFYLNLNSDFSLISKETAVANSISNTVSLTPRFESKWFSFYVPMSLVQYNGFQVGAGLRAGPIYVGSGSVVTALIGDNTKGADVYAGLKIPIYQGGKKDKDGDGVINSLDNCPKIPGPEENNGCPWEDTDGDGVMDNVDKCIDEAGPKENNGCPVVDKDKDGINDKYDKCPEIPGVAENNGCPVIDTDKDGVNDDDDACPEVPGKIDNKGCPWGDEDNDGVLDNVDKCPKQAGVASREGCPEPKAVAPIKEEKLKELQSFAKAIYFNSGKSTFKLGVTGNLDLIANIMQEYKSAAFNIEGHTDSQGAAATNRSLSDKRAKAVLTYLRSKGVDSSRLSSIGYGEQYPIADNNTRDGRAQNRRVEIKLIK